MNASGVSLWYDLNVGRMTTRNRFSMLLSDGRSIDEDGTLIAYLS